MKTLGHSVGGLIVELSNKEYDAFRRLIRSVSEPTEDIGSFGFPAYKDGDLDKVLEFLCNFAEVGFTVKRLRDVLEEFDSTLKENSEH